MRDTSATWGSRQGTWLVAGVVAASWLACAGCGGGGAAPGDAGASGDGSTFVAVDVETIAPERVTAGMPFVVSCVLLDAAGETHTPPESEPSSLRVEPEGSAERTGDGVVATRAGSLEVACAFPSLGLADTTPAIVTVDPGAPARVVAIADRDELVAGETVQVTCEAVDAYGNPVPDVDATRRADPPFAGNTFDGETGTLEHAGALDLHCDVPGTESRPARVLVTPGLPASLLIPLVPERPVYAVGEVIELARVVADRFGNPIADAAVPVVSAPSGGAPLGEARYRYSHDGRYTLTATVSPPTEGDVTLTASVEVVVDSNGPAIDCGSPVDGAILDSPPGSVVTFTGSSTILSAACRRSASTARRRRSTRADSSARRSRRASA